MKILITGGTGLIGKHLAEKLKERGHKINFLSRHKKNIPGVDVYTWNIDAHKIEEEAFQNVDCVVHLAGENIMDKRWTEKQKQKIIDSRVKSGELIYYKMKLSRNRFKTFISASAVGYYGAITTDKILTENDPPANDFIAICCQQWEQMADKFQSLGMRTVKIRTSPVVASEGGMLPKLLIPVKLGLASPVGTGKQYFPWIHIDDLCEIYIKAIEDEQMKGAYNAAAPEHVTNEEMMKNLAEVLKKPFWFPNVPGWLVKLALGEMGGVSLKGSRISSEKIQQEGFNFKFPSLVPALENVLKH